MESTRRDRTTLYAVGVLVLLVVIHLWLRFGALPGPWGADALRYLEAALGAEAAGDDPRTRRRVVLGLVEFGLGVFGRSPAAASVPGVLASALVIPLTWLAARRSVGPWYALVPGLIWAFLGLDIEETREISADALLAPFGAAVAWALARFEASSEEEGEPGFPTALLLGLALGLGFLVKETFVFVAVGTLAAGVVLRPRWRLLLVAGGVALAIAIGGEALIGSRLANASADMARGDAPVALTDAAFLRRVTIDVPLLLVTADLAFGHVFLLLLPLLLLVPLRAAKRDAVAVAATVSLLAFMWMPVSLDRYVLLPAQHARYLMGALPLLLVAVVRAGARAEYVRTERWTVAAGSLLTLPFLVGLSTTGLALAIGVVGLTLPRLFPGPNAARRIRAGHVAALAALLPALPAAMWNWVWVAVLLTALLQFSWVPTARRRTRTAVCLVLLVIMTTVAVRTRFRPDLTWETLARTIEHETVHAGPLAARRVRLSARLRDVPVPSRVVTVTEPDALPLALHVHDRLLLRHVTSREPAWARELVWRWTEHESLGDSTLYRPR